MKSTRHEGAISWEVDERQVPVPALLHAAYRFIDRCYVAVEAAGESTMRVTLVARGDVADEDAWEQLGNDFEDMVAGEVLVQQVEAQNIGTMEFVMAQALGSTEQLAGDDGISEEALEDPLGIAMSWEQRHDKPSPDSATEVPEDAAVEPSDEPSPEQAEQQ
ncbi:MAG: hypothetical protein AAF799_22100 [Myxococcota bacterium]